MTTETKNPKMLAAQPAGGLGSAPIRGVRPQSLRAPEAEAAHDL
jgi:hypothetical protein